MEECAIVAVARYPTPGKVKTRLAVGVGAAAAAEFYRSCAEHVVKECLQVRGAAVYIAYSALEEEAEVRGWLAPLHPRLRFFPQIQSPNLGARLEAALRRALAAGHKKVAIIGTDIPDLTAAVLDLGLHALDSYQAAFGPAVDGGYYLLAVRSNLPDGLFDGVTWSTEAVLEQSVAGVQRVGLSLAPLDRLPRLRDIDTLGDLEEWLADANAAVPAALSSPRQWKQEEHPLVAAAAAAVEAAATVN